MKHTFLVFPGGSTGVALLLLRAAVSVSLVAPPLSGFHLHPSLTIAGYLLSLAVGIGLFTRSVALISAIIPLAVMIASASLPSVAVIIFLLQSIALSLTGPGAISIDAQMFGRRTVHVIY